MGAGGVIAETTHDARSDVMRAELRMRVAAAGGVRAFARLHGYESHSPISQMMQGKRDISEGVANMLGYLKVTRFMKMERRRGS